MIRGALMGLGLALTLGACASSEPRYRDLERMGREYQTEATTQEEATRRDSCGSANFRHLIGTQASAINRAALPPGTRIITPDMMVTQDFSPGRLNIMTGTDGRVSSLRCF